jgi:hypothetical protein
MFKKKKGGTLQICGIEAGARFTSAGGEIVEVR